MSLVFQLRKKKILSSIEKIQANYMIYGFIIAALVGFSTNVIVPFFTNVTEIAQVGPLASTIFVMFTAIAIIKHEIFNVKAIITELVVFTLWVIIFTRMLFADGFDLILDAILLVLFTLFGILLVRGVIREVKQRELLAIANIKLERLNGSLFAECCGLLQEPSGRRMRLVGI